MDSKIKANQLFAQKKYDQAVAAYLDALSSLPPRPTPPPQQDEEPQSEETALGTVLLRSQIHANLALCYLKLSQPEQAAQAATESLLDSPDSFKALHRRSLANEQIGTWSSLSSALDDQCALLTNPSLPASSLPDVRYAIARLEPLVATAAEKEKAEMLSKLRGIGDSLLGTFGLSTKNFQFKQQQGGGGYSMNFVK